jgi:hypothetical protein
MITVLTLDMSSLRMVASDIMWRAVTEITVCQSCQAAFSICPLPLLKRGTVRS